MYSDLFLQIYLRWFWLECWRWTRFSKDLSATSFPQLSSWFRAKFPYVLRKKIRGKITVVSSTQPFLVSLKFTNLGTVTESQVTDSNLITITADIIVKYKVMRHNQEIYTVRQKSRVIITFVLH